MNKWWEMREKIGRVPRYHGPHRKKGIFSIYDCDCLVGKIESSTYEVRQKVEKNRNLTVINMVGTYTLLACMVTVFHMSAYVRKMNQPFVQQKIMSIL